MINILSIKHISSDDGLIFGKLNVLLSDLCRLDFPVADGVVITAPEFHLKTVLEHFDFGKREIFEQSLTLVKKELEKSPVPEELTKELGKQTKFLIGSQEISGKENLWKELLTIWIEEIKQKLWNNGFQAGLTEGLEPQIVIYIKEVVALGSAFYEKEFDEAVINITKGKLEPKDLKILDEIIQQADKKLLLNYQYQWILDGHIKLTGIKQYTPGTQQEVLNSILEIPRNFEEKKRSAVKVFFDLSIGLVVEKEVDGIYIRSEEVFDLNKPHESFEDLIFRLVEAANTFPDKPVLFKLADKSEGFGKVRGSLRLLHQPSLLEPLLEAADFVRHKKNLTNIHLVVPFVRNPNEFLQIKRELASRNLTRKSSLELWLELAVPENLVNLEDYLEGGLDGVVLNMDELIAHLNGFDHQEAELTFYKNEVSGLIKFLEDALKLLHRPKIPFIATGTVAFYPAVLEFLVEKGVYGLVVERYESASAKDLLHSMEKRVILKKLQ